METAYNFYRNFYIHTNGYIPVKPLMFTVFPGDFFQIKNGTIVILGNIYKDNMVPADAGIEADIKLNPAGWSFSNGVSKPYSGMGNGHNNVSGAFDYYKQILAFSAKGSHIFHAHQPGAMRIENWNELQQQLIVMFTQTCFSFREVYVVTESVAAKNWTLAIAGAENAELEIACETESADFANLFGHAASKTVQFRDIEIYHKDEKNLPSFFKAKKLEVRNESTETFYSQLLGRISGQNKWAADFYNVNSAIDNYNTPAYNKINYLDMLPGNELNPNTALQYFRWADATLDDVEYLFANHV